MTIEEGSSEALTNPASKDTSHISDKDFMFEEENPKADSSNGRKSVEIESNEDSHPLRKEYAVSTRWEREMAEYKANRRMPRPVSPLEFFHTIFCCCATRIGGMFSLIERADGTPILIVGPCWPCCSFVTVPLILGIAGLVSYYVLFNEDINMPIWVAGVYLPVVAITICSLSCVSCRDPGLLERVTDEEAGHGGWFWNEQVGSFRPTGAMYCRECKALIEDFDHLCPWTGTGIGRKNMWAFKIFVICVNLSCYFSIGLISYSIIRGMRM